MKYKTFDDDTTTVHEIFGTYGVDMRKMLNTTGMVKNADAFMLYVDYTCISPSRRKSLLDRLTTRSNDTFIDPLVIIR